MEIRKQRIENEEQNLKRTSQQMENGK